MKNIRLSGFLQCITVLIALWGFSLATSYSGVKDNGIANLLAPDLFLVPGFPEFQGVPSAKAPADCSCIHVAGSVAQGR